MLDRKIHNVSKPNPSQSHSEDRAPEHPKGPYCGLSYYRDGHSRTIIPILFSDPLPSRRIQGLGANSFRLLYVVGFVSDWG